jgi:hypothetical protein
MKIPGVKVAALAAASAVLLSGCGDAPYELTESETDIIVNYAAHVAMKYDLNQKEGLQFVWPATAEETAEEPETEGTEISEAEPEENSGGTGTGQTGGATDGTEKTLQELFGNDTVSVEYAGAYLTTSYVESTYYAMNAAAGKQYLVLNITVTNHGDAETVVDNLTGMPSFQIESETVGKASAEITVLLEDFSVYEETLAPGESVNTVLLFTVPDTVTEAEDFKLSVSIEGNNYQIIL